jgi:hypothetical protein
MNGTTTDHTMLHQEFPWVTVNPQTYDITATGTFHGLLGKPGHLMTYRTWELIVQERNITPQGLHSYP